MYSQKWKLLCTLKNNYRIFRFVKKSICLLTDTSSRYVVRIEGPAIFANAISFVTVGLAEGMFAASYLIAWC